MSARRFEVGDLARIVVAAGPRTAQLLGEVVEIVGVDVRAGQEVLDGSVSWNADYAALGPGGERLLAMDYQLAPLNPPDEPAAITRRAQEHTHA